MRESIMTYFFIQGSGFRVQGSGFRVQGSGFRVQGSGGGFAAFLEEGILDTQPSPRGEGKEEAASPQKRKPTPPRCAQQPLPREGARVDAPSFLWKEVPRRGE